MEISIRGILDIVFILDLWNGYDRESVKRNVIKLAHDLFNNEFNEIIPRVDLRLGLVTHDVKGKPAVQGKDFLDTAADFKRSINVAPEGINEFGLPAIDLALDLSWRKRCNRVIAFFADEPVSGGHEPEFQETNLEKLAQKIAQSHVAFCGFGPSCRTYELLSKTPNSTYRIFESIPDWREDAGSLLRQFVISRLSYQLMRAHHGVEELEPSIPIKYNLYQLREVRLPGGLYREMQ